MPDRNRIDADVHCAVSDVSALLPYVDEQWREFLSVTGFREPPALGMTYPAWLPLLATKGEDTRLSRIRDEVLSVSRVAILNCVYGIESFTHPYLGPAVASAINEWLVAEYLEPEPRLLAHAVITPQHVDAAVAEIARIAEDQRFVGVLVPSRSPAGYGTQRYWPILDALADHGLVLNLNVGGGPGTPPTPMNWMNNFFEDHAIATLGFQGQIMSLVFNGVFDRHPDLTVTVSESGWTWLPPLMWRMDQEWKAFRREVPWLQGPPSEYVRRHFRFTTQPTDAPADPEQLSAVYEQLQSDEMLMFASDFPHRQGDGAAALVQRLTPEQIQRLEHDNAWRCFGLERRLAALPGVA
jgi:predicted TIM-barrel fold metal-dependent hydrolase